MLEHIMKYKEKLQPEYRDVFDKAEIYADLKDLIYEEQLEMLMDLLDLLLTAQEEGKSVEQVIGKDVERFCVSYFSGFTMKDQGKKVLKKVYQFMCGVLIIEILEMLVIMTDGGVSFWVSTTDISGYFYGILAGLGIYALANILLRPFMFRWNWLTYKRFSCIYMVGTIMTLIGVCMICNHMVEIKVPIGVTMLVSGIYVFGYVLVRSIWRYRHHGSIRKEKNPWLPKKNMAQRIEEQLPAEYSARFHKNNAKRVQQGKEPMTSEEYMELLKKEHKNSKIFGNIVTVVAVVLVLVVIVNVARDNTWQDTLFFCGVLAVASIPSMLLFRFGSWSDKKREELIQTCEEKGITVLEYEEEEKSE